VRKNFILFDNDGVLVDTEYWYYKATQRALGELGVTLTRDEYMKIMIRGQSSWELARAQGIEEAAIQQKEADRNQYYKKFLLTKNIGIPGVAETLKKLSRYYRMAIITTCHKTDFDVIHRNRSLISFMEFILVREDYEKSKPHPEPYLAGLQRFGAKANEALVVEDSERGLNAALAACIDCVIVHNEFTESHDFTGAIHTIQSLSELPNLLSHRSD
tara:strand:+ start:215 stop:862 length:648 start_codon:yes stop_codon:yes gene_type:complete